MTVSIPTQRIASSRVDEIDLENPDFDLGFGDMFSDHMFQMDYSDGAWRDPRIVPYGPFAIEPGALCLHYGQAVFEGLKAFRGEDGMIRVFRPDRNFSRLERSCQRLCIPTFDRETFLDAIDSLVRIDRNWIPSKRGQALYIRPLVVATESNLNVRPAREYRFFIMTSPVREYFTGGTVALKAERRYTRSAPGGMGYAKTAGNYAASLLPGSESQQLGHDQVLWLDGLEHRYVEEVGQMNIFFKIDGKVLTPDLHGTILPGVTRESVIDILRDEGVAVEECRIDINDILKAHENGSLEEAFGAGTAAVIAPVGCIRIDDTDITINHAEPGPLAQHLYQRIVDIQRGACDDQFGWNRLIE
ncbi:MAG: putative branched-chain-amino-acid aminotransferase [marine bacterium B5-7]|nr:MAG: putative branched-chain-amino-acid aminotransferase [marine bacterium B5-7]